MWPRKYILQSFVYRRNFKLTCRTLRNFSAWHEEDPETKWDEIYQRHVPKSMAEMTSVMMEEVNSPPNSKLLKVAIIGAPNSGKSTLINSLMRWRICSVSSKVHTTKVNCQAVLNQEESQIVFLDTPGLVSPEEVTKHKLQRSLLTEAEMSLKNADLMAVIHDTSNRHGLNVLHPRVLRLLALYPTIPSILILNKLDIFKSKRRLLDATRILTDGIVGGHKAFKEKQRPQKLDKDALIEKSLRAETHKLAKQDQVLDERLSNSAIQSGQQSQEQNQNSLPHTDSEKDIKVINEVDVLEGRVKLTEHQVLRFIEERKGWPKFQDVFMISALEGLGVDDVRNYLISRAYSSPWLFSAKFVTDQDPEEIALMTVREKFLNHFKDEIPYKVKFSIKRWDLDSDFLRIVVRAGCRRQKLVGFFIGMGGFRIADITDEAKEELQKTFRTPVELEINVEYDASIQ